MKKQSIVALLLFLLIPLVLRLGGILFSAVNPEAAAGHPKYARNYHLLYRLRITLFVSSLAVVVVLWFVVCFLVIRAKKRSPLWLLLAPFGPFGFAVLAMLDDRAPADRDRYASFTRRLNWPRRGAWELGIFVLLWMLAWQAMLLKRTLMIAWQAATTGLSATQIMDIQNASSGMWAFSEGNEVMYFVILFYLLLPLVFGTVAHLATRNTQPRTG